MRNTQELLHGMAIRFLKEALVAYESDRKELMRIRVVRVQVIISEIRSILKPTCPELHQQLDSIYCWLIDQLRFGLLEDKIAPIEMCCNILADMNNATDLLN